MRRHVRITLISAAASCLLPFATPAIAELGHPTGCLSCPPVEVPGPDQGAYPEGAPATGPALNTAFPPQTTPLESPGNAAGRAHAKRRHRQHRDPRGHQVRQ